MSVGELRPAPVSAALQTSKLRMQVRGRWVDRARLRARLDDGAAARLVLVSAPPGFGKSTLLADWLASADVRSAWLALDEADNDAIRFARYLTAAADQLAEGDGGDSGPGRIAALPSIEPGRAFDPESALAAILARIEAATTDSEREIAIVLDDYHVIADAAVHSLVAALVDRLPARAQLVLATRSDPPLPLARLRARGELLELRADDLRFTAAEAADLLRSTALDLEPAEVEDLTSRTEGWAAVLRLAAVTLQGRADHADVVRRFGATHRFVLDYVVDEVFAGLDPETHDFLLRTSILDRLCGPLCDAVTGRADGQARLEGLERDNLLIVPLDEERCWYRYHALFADILRARLAALHPGEVDVLHARASAWHEDHGDAEQAIAHALAAADLVRAGRLVGRAFGPRMRAGELRTVRRWLDALPAEMVRADAALSIAAAWHGLFTRETADVARRIADAERAFAAGSVDAAIAPEVRPHLALLRSHLASTEGDTDTAIAQARLAMSLDTDALPKDVAANLRGSATVLLAVALMRAGELDAAADVYEASLPDLRTAGNELVVGRAISDVARIAIARNDPLRAVRVCEAELAREDVEGSVARSPAVWAALADARAQLGEIGAAEAAARRALELATLAGDAPSAAYARKTLARVEAGPVATERRPSGSAPGLVESLSNRELEVLGLVARGRSNTEIASELFVTVGTVKAHIHSICGKLGAANRVQAIVRARDLGLID